MRLIRKRACKVFLENCPQKKLAVISVTIIIVNVRYNIGIINIYLQESGRD